MTQWNKQDSDDVAHLAVVVNEIAMECGLKSASRLLSRNVVYTTLEIHTYDRASNCVFCHTNFR